jgi:hypothetical protein
MGPGNDKAVFINRAALDSSCNLTTTYLAESPYSVFVSNQPGRNVNLRRHGAKPWPMSVSG